MALRRCVAVIVTGRLAVIVTHWLLMAMLVVMIRPALLLLVMLRATLAIIEPIVLWWSKIAGILTVPLALVWVRSAIVIERSAIVVVPLVWVPSAIVWVPAALIWVPSAIAVIVTPRRLSVEPLVSVIGRTAKISRLCRIAFLL